MGEKNMTQIAVNRHLTSARALLEHTYFTAFGDRLLFARQVEFIQEELAAAIKKSQE